MGGHNAHLVERVPRPATLGRTHPNPLSGEARLLYRWLSRRGATPLADATPAGVPGIERALRELTALGLVQHHGELLVARPYHDVLRDLLAAQARLLGQAMHGLAEGQRVLQLLINEHDTLLGDATETVQTVEPPESGSDWMEQADLRPQQRLAALHPASDYTPDLLDASLSRAADDLGRGVALQVVHQRSMLAHPRRAEYLWRLQHLGAQVRLREHLPFRMVVIDDQAVGCSVTTSGSGVETFLLRGQRLVTLLGRMFDTVWYDADPLPTTAAIASGSGSGPRALPASGSGPLLGQAGPGAAAAPSHPVTLPAALSPQHLTILRCLAEGATDQAIARTLGVTPRTVTRRLNEIYEALGVQSRFQAGSAARRLGLV